MLSSDDGREVTPVSIPNTEVKLSCADGSTQVREQDVARLIHLVSIFLSKTIVLDIFLSGPLAQLVRALKYFYE